ncbi:MAG: hypothetical protein FWH29_03700 [Methanobrevibacter sp.]|nr:hypothetical protein [Methanobrevibacter sp.]
MTAEILIMNKSAVALAADSMVTVTKGEKEKTYEGVNKLFMLSNDPPMGIMTYANANFMGIPMETLIKQYKKKISKCDIISFFKKTFNDDNPSVKLYMQSFLNFLEKYCNEKSDESIIEYYMTNSFNALKKLVEENGEKAVKLFLKVYVKDLEEIYSTSESDDFEKFDYIFNDLFNILKISNDEKEEYFPILKVYFLYRIFTNNRTGIVIAGFDEQNPFPSYCSKYIFGIINKKLKSLNFKHKKINNFNLSEIEPFAPTDVVETYLSGMNPHITEKINEYVDEAIRKYPDSIYNILKVNDKIDENALTIIKESFNQLNDHNDDLIENLNDTIKDAGKESFESVKSAISVMPKEELGNMCESLIHITSLKRKVSAEIETVGGDIDVALITKGDGFVWIKRKHYFDPKLNHHFFDR